MEAAPDWGAFCTMDIAPFLEPVEPDAPCGPNLEYDPEFLEMSLAAEGKPEQSVGDSVIDAVEPDWKTVRTKAWSLLGRTRDMRVLLYLAQGSLRTEGFVGLGGTFELLGGLVGRYWEHIHPQLDPDLDNDPIQRLNILTSFASRETLLRPIEEAVLVRSRAGRFSLRDVHIARGTVPAPAGTEHPPDLALIDAAFMDCELEELQATADHVKNGLAQVEAAFEALSGVLEPAQIPEWDPLRKVLREIDGFLQQQLARRGVGVEEGQAEGAEAGAGGPAAVPGRVNSREEVIRVLDLTCDYFERNEPSSPVPLLLRRAKRLVSKDFLDILKDLAPDGVTQAEAIRGPEPE